MKNHIIVMIVMLGSLILAACGQAPASQQQAAAPTAAESPPVASGDTDTLTTTTSADATTDQPVQAVTVAFPYIPNVQFAPYYVADSNGYYTEAGLDVTFEYMYEDEAVQLLAQDKAQFGFISGISVLLARQNDIPLVTVATVTQDFPVAFFSKESTPLASVDDLTDKSIGIPGRFGASYYGLLAVLYAHDLQETDLNIMDIGFNQVQMVAEDNVEVAVGYATNEPIQLRSLGYEVATLRVADIYPLVSDGIITTDDYLAAEPAVVEAFVEATLRGLSDTIADPQAAFQICLTYIPEAEGSDQELQQQVLEESVRYWQADTLGYSDPEVWQQTSTFLLDNDLLTKEMPLEEAYTNRFVE
jgi:NitT/TauT family transport system substrate-binding protein